MTKFRTIIALALTVILFASFAGTVANADDLVPVRANVTFMYQEARSMLTLINAFRTGSDAWILNKDNTTRKNVKNLKALKYDYNLEKSAMQRAVEIAVYFSHTRPDGSAWKTALPKGNYTKGENIAFGCMDVNAAFNAFREDDRDYSGQGHRRNMLRKEFTRVGFGAVRCGNTIYWVQEFGSGKAGGKDENLYKSKQVNVSWSKLLNSGARNFGPAVAKLTIQEGTAVPMPDVVIYSATGCKLTLPDFKWDPADGVIVSDGAQLIGAAIGDTQLTADVYGNTLILPASVTAPETQPVTEEEPVPEMQQEPETESAPDSEPQIIDDYDTALGLDNFMVLLMDDECFEE